MDRIDDELEGPDLFDQEAQGAIELIGDAGEALRPAIAKHQAKRRANLTKAQLYIQSSIGTVLALIAVFYFMNANFGAGLIFLVTIS